MKKPLKSTFPEKPATYIIKDPVSETFYIGSTSNLNQRLYRHRTDFNNGKHDNPNLQEIYNLNPKLEVEYEIKESKIDATNGEQQLLDKHYENNLNLNQSNITHGRMSDTLSIKERENIRKRMLGNQIGLGRSHSDETKQKISLANKGNTYSTGRIVSDSEKEATRQRSLGNTYCLGRVLNEESKQKISDARKGIQFSDDHKQKLSEKKANPVIIDGIEYHNCVKAAEALEIPINRVQQRVKSKTFTTWIRKKDIENVT